jgi:hypothetical protein
MIPDNTTHPLLKPIRVILPKAPLKCSEYLSDSMMRRSVRPGVSGTLELSISAHLGVPCISDGTKFVKALEHPIINEALRTIIEKPAGILDEISQQMPSKLNL